MIVGVVLGPTRTLFWPAGVFFSLGFWHRYTAEPLTVTSISRVSMPRPASEAVQVVDVEFVPVPVIVHAGSPPLLKWGLDASAAETASAAVAKTAAKTKNVRRIRKSSSCWCAHPKG